jgi:hypothetical protein
VQAMLQDGRLHLVDDAPEFQLTIYLAYFNEAKDNPAVQAALQGLEYIKRVPHTA